MRLRPALCGAIAGLLCCSPAAAQQVSSGPPVIGPIGAGTVTPSGGTTASSLSTLTSRIITPMDFGAVGNGTTDDTAAVQAAVNAATSPSAGGTLYLGQRLYCIRSISWSKPLRIIGAQSPFQTVSTITSGFKACAPNLNLLTVNAGADGTTLENFAIVANASGQNTSGYVLTVNANHVITTGLSLTDPCNGILEIGNNNQYLYNVVSGFNEPNDGACTGMTIGTAAVQSIDARIEGNLIALQGNSASGTGAYGTGMLFVNAGGGYVTSNDILFSNIGTKIAPPSGATVQWTFFDHTVLGDSTYSDGLHIAPAAGGTVEGISISNSWAGDVGNWKGAGTWNNATGIYAENPFGGTVTGLRIIGFRQMGSGGGNIAIQFPDTQIIGSSLCGGGNAVGANAATGLSINSANAIVSGNIIASSCEGVVGQELLYGIHLQSGAAGISITGNFIGVDGGAPLNTGIGLDNGTTLNTITGNLVNATTSQIIDNSTDTGTTIIQPGQRVVVAGTAAVTCSGAPSAAFATSLGVVTHC